MRGGRGQQRGAQRRGGSERGSAHRKGDRNDRITLARGCSRRPSRRLGATALRDTIPRMKNTSSGPSPIAPRMRLAMPSELLTERRGTTLVLTISNPPTRNALSAADHRRRHRGAQRRRSNPEVRSVVITAPAAHFCAGGNLQRLLERRAAGEAAQRRMLDHLHGWIEAIRTFPKPVIAAVEGAAAGAGFSLALACDFDRRRRRTRSSSCPTASSACRPMAADSWRLAQALPRQLVSGCCWLAEPVSAAPAAARPGHDRSACPAARSTKRWRWPSGCARSRPTRSPASRNCSRRRRGARSSSSWRPSATTSCQPVPRQRRHRHRGLPREANAALFLSRRRARRCHLRDRPWTPHSYTSKNSRTSKRARGSPPSHRPCATRSCDAPSCNASRTAS